MGGNICRTRHACRSGGAPDSLVSDRLWDVPDIIALIESEDTQAGKKRGQYKKAGRDDN
jgi:hypothetical protein